MLDFLYGNKSNIKDMKLMDKYFNKYKRKYLHWKWQRRWNKAWSISCHKAYDFYNEYIDACSPWYYFWNELEGLKNK